jgi:ubiquinone/menaquinone biosynthesis C-methylase UbiE
MDSLIDKGEAPVSRDEAQAANLQVVIENVLRMHSGVREATVVHDGCEDLVAFVVPDDGHMDAVLGCEKAGSTALGRWRKACDLSQLTREAASAPVGFNTIGWDSSYTRQPIPVEEMREWVDATVADILQLAPTAVYEVGCGTGMLLMQIAPRSDRYVAVDFSSVVLDGLRRQLRTVPFVAERVELMERQADNFDGLEENSFDTMLLNSVVQYFPNVAYLTRVLKNAVNIVRPGGYVFVGDIRSLPLLPAFESSVELFQAADHVAGGDLRGRIRRRIEREQELVVSPAYFLSLRHKFPKISRVEIRPLRLHADNEMSRYRYQAIIYVGHETEVSSDTEFKDWTEDKWALEDIRSMLLQHPGQRIGIKGIRNARIEKDTTALATLRNTDPALTAGALRHRFAHNTVKGILPQALIDLETEGLGFAVFLSWAACRPDGSYDACFVPTHSPQGITLPAIDWPEPDASAFVRFANAPGQQGKLHKEFINQLVTHSSRNLAAEMVPREIVLVDTLARTPDGDIDPRVLLAARSASYLP